MQEKGQQAQTPTKPNNDEDEYELVPPSRLERFKYWYLTYKQKTIPITVAALLVVAFGVPASRYALLGLVVKKSYVVAVIDAESHLPVSQASVAWGSKTGTTDPNGKIRFSGLPTGTRELHATKRYYETYSGSQLAPLRPTSDITIMLTPTGSWVPLKIVDQETGQAVAGATVSALETQVQTNNRGEATIVVPETLNKVTAHIAAQGYQTRSVLLTVSHQAIKENTFTITKN